MNSNELKSSILELERTVDLAVANYESDCILFWLNLANKTDAQNWIRSARILDAAERHSGLQLDDTEDQIKNIESIVFAIKEVADLEISLETFVSPSDSV